MRLPSIRKALRAPEPPPLSGVVPCDLNEAIRRAHPTVDSPLGRKIKGEITQEEYEVQYAAKQARERRARRG